MQHVTAGAARPTGGKPAPAVRVHAAGFDAAPVPARQYDLGFGDPPYNIGVEYRNGPRADRMREGDYHAWTHAWLGRMADMVRPGGAVFVLINDEWAATAAECLRWAKRLEMRNWIKWRETFGEQTTKKFARTSRHLLYFVKPLGKAGAGEPRRRGFTFNDDEARVPSDRMIKYADPRANPEGKVMGDVWDVPRVAGTHAAKAKGFPNQIPESLLERVVKVCTDPGDRVLEFFVGSGSLARVCLQEGRGYDGWEVNPTTARKAHARIQERAAELRAEK